MPAGELVFRNGRRLEWLRGDLTTVAADAIVNAANAGLHGGGGVDGAIHRAGGPAIMKELDIIRAASGGCRPGSAVVTRAGRLPASWVIHAVGPIYRDGRSGEPELLASAYAACLDLAVQRGANSISFPSISTGAYGYPVGDAAEIAIGTVIDRLRSADAAPARVSFVLFDDRTLAAYQNVAERRGNLASVE